MKLREPESLRVFEGVAKRARNAGISVRGYVSTAFVCPYAGEIAPRRVREVGKALIDLGCDEVAVSDTVVESVVSVMLVVAAAGLIASDSKLPPEADAIVAETEPAST